MLRSLGLGGDGDEVDAIERVEHGFQIGFAGRELDRFVTVGDVWRALLLELGVDEQEAAPLWTSFVALLGEETLREEDFTQVGLETLLLARPLRDAVRDALRRPRGA